MPLSLDLPRHAAERPQAPALRLGALRLNYAELVDHARTVAARMAALPLRADSAGQGLPLAALILGNHPQAAVWIAAALSQAMVVAVLDPSWPHDTLTQTLMRLSPEAVIVADDAGHAAAQGHPIIDLRHAPPPLALHAPLPLPRPDQPFFIGFTSGSTGVPKAFRRCRREWRASLDQGQGHFGLNAGSHTLAPGPLAHGLTLYALAETLAAGACFTGLPHFSAAAMAQALPGARRLVGVPTMLTALADHHDQTGATFPDLTGITCAGARLDAGLITRLGQVAPHAPVTDYYGASELGFVATGTHPIGRADPEAGCGTAFPGVDIAIRDGLVWVRSALVLDGYLWGDDGTGLRCDGDWRSVGDLGRIDAAGRLHLLGRADGMVITGGRNVHPEAVARALSARPDLREAEVLAIPDRYLGQRLVAVVVAHDAAMPLSGPVLMADLATRLPRYKLPRMVWRVTTLPRTTSGKTARAELAGWIAAGDPRLMPLWPAPNEDCDDRS